MVPGTVDSEREKAEHAELAIDKAIAASDELRNIDLEIVPQGSYRNRTNVRQDSDVDICVRVRSTFNYSLPKDMTMQQAGFVVSDYKFPDFKNAVERALVKQFGKSGVRRGAKAFDVHENTYRVDADVLPAFELREYYWNGRVADCRLAARGESRSITS